MNVPSLIRAVKIAEVLKMCVEEVFLGKVAEVGELELMIRDFDPAARKNLEELIKAVRGE